MKRPATDAPDDLAVTTAVDFLKRQHSLEQQAKELMPYNPNECTYLKGPIRQPVFACLTCFRNNNSNPIGICYSCSIQCHSSHDLVELFAKRDFVCDCGTTRMSKTVDGGCKLRLANGSETPSISLRTGTGLSHRSWGSISSLELPADDIPGTNSYNQNYKGLFCGCQSLYNPLEETGNMIQCYFGYECGEDWYHEDCILGYKRGILQASLNSGEKLLDKCEPGENLLDKLTEPGEDAANDTSIMSSSDDLVKVPHFPDLDDFDVFVCWKCVSQFKEAFEALEQHQDIVLASLPHLEAVESVAEWERRAGMGTSVKTEPEENADIKKETGESADLKAPSTQIEPSLPTKPTLNPKNPVKSYFFKFDFRDKLKQLLSTENKSLKSLLLNHSYLYLPDPVYEPPEDDDDTSTTGSLLDLGAEALLSVPREQALEGLQAYDKIKSRLKDFFRPFAEQGKVVTEEEVRTFFGNIKKEDNA